MLGKLFAKKTPESERARADESFERGDLGTAKLAYERALSLVPASNSELRVELGARVDACRDELARRRVVEADRLLALGAHELAVGELDGALEVAASTALKAEIEQRIENSERSEARAQLELAEQSDDERFETIAGSWEQEQLDEYDAHGEPLRDALLALHDGNAKGARPVLEQLAAADLDTCYLWFELGRARVLDADLDGGRSAFETFLARLPAGAGGDARLSAHVELAAMLRERGELEAAIAQHQAAIEALPDDPRAYLAMASFFRREGLAAEAIEVLEAATDALEGNQRPWRVTLELGLAHADVGATGTAVELLEDVVSYFVGRQHLDLPPECAVRLAQLHEQAGNASRALDLYRLLAGGSDLPALHLYHREAARLMLGLNLRSDAKRMLQRALEVAPDDPAVREDLTKRLAELQ
jgi:tetratricopeptide (TPR) repeat protein